MSDTRAVPDAPEAFCIGCGYRLRDLPSNRCPECGRAFDPSDPRSMSLGLPLRPWQRWLLRPLGWPTIALALLGTIGLVYLSRWPWVWPEPWSVLVQEFGKPRAYLLPLTFSDVVYYSAVVLWAIFIVLALFWTAARRLVPRSARRLNLSGINTRRRHRALAAAAIVSLIFLIFGWEGRVGRRWMARAMAPTTPYSTGGAWDPWRMSPISLTPEQTTAALECCAVNLPGTAERFMALKLLIENAGRAAVPSLVRASQKEQDTGLLVWELRLIGLCRDPNTASLLIARLQDPRPEIRAAAADAIGILRRPSYAIEVPASFWISEPLSLDSEPQIDLRRIVTGAPPAIWPMSVGKDSPHDLSFEAPIPVDPSVRSTLEAMMMSGPTEEERQAAARSLVNWPPSSYTLRVAEWGVWINNDGHMALPWSIRDEIPPFVHGTGNPISAFQSYFVYPMMVTKPIVHLTSDLPLAADIEIQINQGRPWFSFPLPDDFAIGQSRGEPLGEADNVTGNSAQNAAATDDFTTPAIAKLSDPREGYPWLFPHHRLSRSGGYGREFISGLGLRWQSLIVSPQRLPWMKLPTVPANPKFKWWERLRQVPSCWVANRGEAERFLYYDGPTRALVPYTAVLNEAADRLALEGQYSENEDIEAIPRPAYSLREGLYVEVHHGAVRGQLIEILPNHSMFITLNPMLKGEEVETTFRQMLLGYGLTAPEAEGLIAAWSPQFFQTEGRRFILRMSPHDYDFQCPMHIRPEPTELVRLGLVLTEFDPTPATRPAHP